MTRFRGRILSKPPAVHPNRWTHVLPVEPVELIHVFVSLVVGGPAEMLVAWEWTIRMRPVRLVAVARTRQIDLSEGRRQ